MFPLHRVWGKVLPEVSHLLRADRLAHQLAKDLPARNGPNPPEGWGNGLTREWIAVLQQRHQPGAPKPLLSLL
eukprot:721103-Prorocentrum_minimum.AAC.1